MFEGKGLKPGAFKLWFNRVQLAPPQPGLHCALPRLPHLVHLGEEAAADVVHGLHLRGDGRQLCADRPRAPRSYRARQPLEDTHAAAAAASDSTSEPTYPTSYPTYPT
jgi:hypothetical protein